MSVLIPGVTRRSVLAGVAGMTLASGAHAQSRPFAAAAAYSARYRGVSFVVMDRAGRILTEDYPAAGAPDRGWELASGTKSFCGIAVAAGVQDGLFRLDERCADTLTEWRGDGRADITLRQLLTLTGGLAPGGIARPPTYAAAVATPLVTRPGQRFAYGPTPFQVFGEMLRRKLTARREPSDPVAYYQRRLFDPLEVRPQVWRRGTDGQPHLPSGAALTARDWARFGAFVLCGGDGRLDPAALAACFDGSTANPGYGLTWWLLRPGLIGPSPRAGIDGNSFSPAAVSEDIVMAAGAGNQRLYLLRRRGLVVVRQATGILEQLRGQRSGFTDAAFLTALLQ
jgi:CubicO group peptidase (beta-lactamase class C family)